jgi:hypothetical protein
MDNVYFKIMVRRIGRQLRHPTSAQGQRGTGCSHALQDLAAIPFFSHQFLSRRTKSIWAGIQK